MAQEAVEHLRWQGDVCAKLGSPMYGELLALLADDLAEDGPTADVVAGYDLDPGPSALALRLAGSLHRLVLERRAAGLAAFYPSVGGTWQARSAWPHVEHALVEHRERVRRGLATAPQTNEIGRASALMGGLLHLDEAHRLPLRLREIGSSGGLNLNAHRFAYLVDGRLLQGPGSSPVRLEDCWRGALPAPWPDVEVADAVGSDVAPVDVTTTEGRLLLTAYVWPDQAERMERLRAAFRVAATYPVDVRRVDAVTFLAGLAPAEGATTVVWHSVMWQYLSREDQAAASSRLAALGRAATARAPFVHLAVEPDRRAPEAPVEFLVRLTVWPGGTERLLGVSVPHGLPTTWE